MLGRHTIHLRKHRTLDAIDLIDIALNSADAASPSDAHPSSESTRLEILAAVRGLDEAGVAEIRLRTVIRARSSSSASLTRKASTRDIWLQAACQGSAFGAFRMSQTFIGPGFGIKEIEGVLVKEPDQQCAWLRIASALDDIDAWSDYRTADQNAAIRDAVEKTLPSLESKLDGEQQAQCEPIASGWQSSRQKQFRDWRNGLSNRRLLVAKIPIHCACLIEERLASERGTVSLPPVR